MINWAELNGLRNAQQIHAALTRIVTAETYGEGAGEWTLSELIRERSEYAIRARRLIEGIDDRGEMSGMGPMSGPDGPLRFKLKVLTRQACMTAGDGQPINTWDTTVTEPTKMRIHGVETNELAPDEYDEAKPGDKVWIKGNMIVRDPMTGKRLTKSGKQAMISRKEAELDRPIKSIVALHHWRQVPVDNEGCITVSYLDALHLLSTRGERITTPKHTTRGTRSKDEAPTRRITNWHFREVPLDYTAPKPKQRRKPNKEQEKVATAEPTV